MKTAINAVLATIFLCATLGVYAQPAQTNRNDRGARFEQMLSKMKTELSLTDKQVTQIRDLEKETMTKMKEEGADKMAIFKDKRAKMEKILTAEQNKKWEAMRKEMAAKRSMHGKEKGDGQQKEKKSN